MLPDHIIISHLTSDDQGKRNLASKALYKASFSSIRNYVYQNSGDDQDAFDLFQDTMITLIRRLERPLQLTCKLHFFFLAIARRLWLKELRDRGKKPSVNPELELQEASVLEEMINQERKEKVRTALKSLKIDCQRVIMYFVYYEWDMETIADTMNYANRQVARNKKCACMKKLTAAFKRLQQQ
ncbi:MAG: sigma-70 family RNA polymerase sigma factor [Bacteroidota bacterium]